MGGSVALRNPDTGVVFTFGVPLPPGVQRQYDGGHLRPADETPPEPLDGETVARPRRNASHQAWINYAASQGMSRDEAASMGRDELRDRFADPGFDPDSVPEVTDGDAGDAAERIL